jgi:hypothetical protein
MHETDASTETVIKIAKLFSSKPVAKLNRPRTIQKKIKKGILMPMVSSTKTKNDLTAPPFLVCIYLQITDVLGLASGKATAHTLKILTTT